MHMRRIPSPNLSTQGLAQLVVSVCTAAGCAADLLHHLRISVHPAHEANFVNWFLARIHEFIMPALVCALLQVVVQQRQCAHLRTSWPGTTTSL